MGVGVGVQDFSQQRENRRLEAVIAFILRGCRVLSRPPRSGLCLSAR
jgi:hypothetical protein